MKRNAEVITVIALAVVLRFAAVLTGSLTPAEGVLVRAAGCSWSQLFQFLNGGAAGYFSASFVWLLLLKFWSSIASADIWLRLLPLIPGLLVVPVAWAIGNRIAGRRAAFWTALMVAVSPPAIAFSKTLDFSSLLFLFSLLAVKYWLDLLLDEPTERRAVLAGVFLCLAVCVHPIALLMVVPMNVLFLAYRGRHRTLWVWLAAQGAVALLVALWLPEWTRVIRLQPQPYIVLGQLDTTYMPGSYMFAAKFLELYCRTFYALSFFRFPMANPNYLVLPALVLVPFAFHAAILYGFRPWKDCERQRMILFIYFVTLYGAACLLGLMGMDLSRLLIPLFVPFYVLIATGALRSDSRGLKWLLIIGFGAAAIHFTSSYFASEAKRPDWRRAAAYLDVESKRNERIYFLEGSEDGAFLNYAVASRGRTVGLFAHFSTLLTGGRVREEDIIRPFNGSLDLIPPESLAQVFGERRRVWIVADQATPDESARIQADRNWLDQNATVLKKKTFGVIPTKSNPVTNSVTATLYQAAK